MARFRYRMQNILDIKNKMETQAKMQYAAARARLTEEEEKLEGLQNRKAFYLKEGKKLRESQLNVRDIIDNKAAILHMDEQIKAQLLQVRMAEKNLETAREQLTQVMQERKTHELLKEKAFEAFMQEEKAKESKEIDELTSYTYGQKIGE